MFNDLRNRFDYFIRSNTKFSRKDYFEESPIVKETNYVLDVLERVFNPQFSESLRVLEIGCKNWEFVRGEYSFFQKYCNELFLDGVEIDAYRLYADFYSRYEVAKFYMKDLKNTNYYADDLLNINHEYDYILWFLPFVTMYPLQRWGLPEKYFMPEKLLEHAYSILKKEMLIINQGKEEAEIQKDLFERLNISYEFFGEITSSKLEFKNTRYGFVVRK